MSFWSVSELEVARMRHDQAAISSLFERTEPDTGVLDIDKMWHGLHWLMTGGVDDDVLGDVVFGGQSVGKDLGYGPLRVLMPREVVALSEALSAVSEASLRARWQPDEMMARGVYPAVWDEGDWVLEEELLPIFEDVRRLFAQAAKRNEAIAMVID